MRDRLIEQINQARKECATSKNCKKCSGYGKEGSGCISALIADFILADGWMRPPCRVGDTVYEVDSPEYGIIICKVTRVFYDSEEVVVNVIDGHGKGSEYYFDFDDFGKTVFLTREEAEAALKGGVE